MSEPNLVTVYRSQGILAAEVVKAKLEAAGVPVLLKYESAALVFGLTVDGLGLVEVMVPEEWVVDAEALVSEDATDESEAEPEAAAEEPRPDAGSDAPAWE